MFNKNIYFNWRDWFISSIFTIIIKFYLIRIKNRNFENNDIIIKIFNIIQRIKINVFWRVSSTKQSLYFSNFLVFLHNKFQIFIMLLMIDIENNFNTFLFCIHINEIQIFNKTKSIIRFENITIEFENILKTQN